MSRREAPLHAPVDADGRLSSQLRQSRKATGLGLRAAASLGGCSPGHLSHVEHGRNTPSEPLVVALDIAYGANRLLLSLYEEVLAERRRRSYTEALSRRGVAPPLLVKPGNQMLWTPPADQALPLDGDESVYEGEVQSPNGILLQRGTWFTKSWQIRNVGTVAWRDRFLQRVGPTAAATLVATDPLVPVPETEPGQSVLLEVRCRAQWVESTSVAHFKMVFADGRLCWPNRYSHGVDLLVTATTAPSCACLSCTAIGPLAPRHSDGSGLLRPKPGSTASVGVEGGS